MTKERSQKKAKNASDFGNIRSEYSDEKYVNAFENLEKYFANEWNWLGDPISEYVARCYLKPRRPKFLYYDEYFALPSRISIEKLNQDALDENDQKTAKALFELADINTEDLISSDEFENFVAELEAIQAAISPPIPPCSVSS